MNSVFDMLMNIGAAAYCAPTELTNILRMHPHCIEDCKSFSAGITASLIQALSAQMIDTYTVRDYLRMLCELQEYRSMFLYIVLCFVSTGTPISEQFLEYGQNHEMLKLLMRYMLSDMDKYNDDQDKAEDMQDE